MVYRLNNLNNNFYILDNSCKWFNSSEQENQSVLYDKLFKQYEILGVVASLIIATLGIVLDNKNIYL